MVGFQLSTLKAVQRRWCEFLWYDCHQYNAIQYNHFYIFNIVFGSGIVNPPATPCEVSHDWVGNPIATPCEVSNDWVLMKPKPKEVDLMLLNGEVSFGMEDWIGMNNPLISKYVGENEEN